MRTLPTAIVLLFALPALAVDGHCGKGEQTLFSCRIANSTKQLALCSSQTLDESGWLVYRFGAPGKIELEFPAQKEGSLNRFSFNHYMRYQTDYTDIAFGIGKTQYSVYDYYQGEEKPSYARGVRITTAQGQEVDLSCRGKVKSELVKLEGLLPCADKDNCSSP